MIGRTCSACWFVAIEPTIPQGPRHEPERTKAQEERALVFFFRFSTPLWHHVRVRICPACSREYPDERTHCQDDGIKLVVLDKAAAMRAEQLINQLVDGRYRVESVVGHGGMGTIYRCRHVVVGKQFAMKVLRPPRSGHNEGVLARFSRESQTANALRSRHIIDTTDFGQLPDGPFYVVMELLEGVDLARAMREQRLTPAAMLHVFIQIADTLEQVHAHGIVHRDLKPDNVFLVTENGDPLFVKLLDFGIAKVLHGDSSELTEEGMILGTPHYMAPEQARSQGVDHRADIYSLGIMMYRAFTGRLPFTAESTIGVITRHATDMPEPPSQFAQLDPMLDALILRCMAKRPEDRPQRMAEVSRDLRAIAMKSSGYGWPVPSRPSQAPYATGQNMPAYTTGNMPAYTTGSLPVMDPSNASMKMPGPMSPSMQIPGAPQISDGATQRGMATSHTGMFQAPQKRSSAVLVTVVVAALSTGGIGAVVAFGLLRKTPAPTDTSSAVAAATTQPSSTIPSSVPTNVVADRTASAEPATSTSASAEPKTRTGSRTTGRTPPPPPPSTTKPTRRPEIRSPFE